MIGNNQLGIGTAKTVIHGVRPKGSKQRLVDGPNAPRCQHGDQQINRTRQHAGNPVAFTEPLAFEPARQLAALLIKFGIGQRIGLALGIFMY